MEVVSRARRTGALTVVSDDGPPATDGGRGANKQRLGRTGCATRFRRRSGRPASVSDADYFLSATKAANARNDRPPDTASAAVGPAVSSSTPNAIGAAACASRAAAPIVPCRNP